VPQTTSPASYARTPTFITKISIKQADKSQQKLDAIGEDSCKSFD
jgi:hypothetical protein